MFTARKMEAPADRKDAGAPARGNEDEQEQRKRIAALHAEIRALGGTVMSGSAPGMSLAMEEEFLRNVIAYEKGPFTTHFAQLERSGFRLPMSQKLDRRQLSARLAELIQRLAAMGVYLTHTDHLSERELYDWLRREGLHEQIPDLPPNPSEIWYLDPLGGYSADEIRIFQQYYATEEDREQHALNYPGEPIPDRVKPPYDRDRTLPKSPLDGAN